MYIKKYEKFKNCDCGCGDKSECKPYILKENVTINDDLKYHIENEINLSENVFRYGSEKYFNFINYVRDLYLSEKIHLSKINEEFINTDVGKKGVYYGNEVWLDIPHVIENKINEAEYKGRDVELNKPKRGGSKKFYVYVKKDNGKVKKVRFGASGGGQNLSVKLDDPDARKSFAARHKCDKKKDKTKAGYWSCRLPRFAKSVGLSYDGSAQWW